MIVKIGNPVQQILATVSEAVTMEYPVDLMGPADIRSRKFHLPLSVEAIRLDREGAEQIARYACRMAAAKASPFESDRQYALRFAAFLTGTVAAQCASDTQWFAVFEKFLEHVRHCLETGCSHCSDEEHDWGALGVL